MATFGNRKVYIQIGTLNLFVLTGGFGVNKFLQDSTVWLSLSCAAIGIITFFGLLGIGRETGASDHNMRTATTGAIIVVYLTLVSIYAFYLMRSVDKIPPINEMMLTSFTTVAGVVIASYFGASAYIEGRKPDRGRDERAAGTVSSEPSSGG